MKGPRGTKLAMPFHPLYTPLGPSPGGMDKKMTHQNCWNVLVGHSTFELAVTSMVDTGLTW